MINKMKREINYRGRQIIEGTNGYYTAYPSNHSAHTARDFKTLKGAKNYIDSKLDK